MRKEEFFEILGELDDKLVAEAKKPVKKGDGGKKVIKRKPVNWKVLGAMAACFMLICIALGQIPFMNHQNEGTADSPMADSSEEAPMEEAEASAEEAAPMEEAAPAEKEPMEEAAVPAEETSGEETSEDGDREGMVPVEESPEEAVPGDIAPMIYVNDTLYITSPMQEDYAEWKEEFSYLGKIESEVSSDREPEENFQANDPLIGCEVYQYGEDIVVKINGKYWLYVEYGGEKR